ncbi:probable helicase with zinc finger domain [Nilaparvata lugens]|uniref:probable helicase with zinc finger domain n=1 Tax=Nilaparvata lugens TaxID=108931 RepID=UPI00193DC298|nr:probable helicase with zinc finger domain [Nilaparvata lugens]
MNEVEIQAQELLRHRDWIAALGLFDQLLNFPLTKTLPKERIVSYLLGRSECFLELGKHEAVVLDCRRVIKLLNGLDGGSNCGIRARRRLVHALFTLRRFAEAEAAASEWIAASGGVTNSNPEAASMLERVRLILQMANGQKSHKNIMPLRIDEEILSSDYKLDSLMGDERTRRNRKHPVELIDDASEIESQDQVKHISSVMQVPDNFAQLNMALPPPATSHSSQVDDYCNYIQQNIQQVQNMKLEDDDKLTADGRYSCTYCCLTFVDRSELRSHCQSEAHQTVIMSDEGRDWKWRPPPRGYTCETYGLCESWADNGTCRYGEQCVEAHGAHELNEWRERFQYRRMKLQRACEKELYGKSYTEQLLERWVQSSSPDRVMRERVDNVEESCSEDLVTTVSSKVSQSEWNFTLLSNTPLRAVALLQDAHRNHFVLRHIVCVATDSNVTLVNAEPVNDQEWTEGAGLEERAGGGCAYEQRVRVTFTTDIYGTFRQSVVFDFGVEPVLVRHLCVDVVPVTDADKIKEIKKDLILSNAERWDKENCEVISFSSPVVPVTSSDAERENELLTTYPPPRADTFTLTQSTVSEKRLTRNNYRARMHELLCVEEMARYEQVARYNLTAPLRLANCYLLSPSGVAASTAKYAHNGELFALMTLGKNVSEDTSAGRLILNNCTTVLLAPAKNETEEKVTEVGEDGKKPRKVVYEALIEDKGKNVVYLRLSAATVSSLDLKADTEFSMDVQFQLNRVPYCEWHLAIDKIADFRVIFPETYLEPNIPWTPQRQWSETLDSRLNLKQKEAVVAITTPVSIPLPPILIIGPFGTGKTYTLAQAMKEVLLQPNTRVLICTHSNSAADLYIKDYLHPYVEAGHQEAKPLRIYYHKRWVATVNQVVQKYCLIESTSNLRTFKVPTLDDIVKHRVVVVTLSISMFLSTIGLKKGHFTHILLDEAAQAMECEAIMPLALANEETRIVLAGDHMQLSPELFSQFAKERHLHVSLLERLYDHYPSTFPCKILLCENYRAHEAIIRFTSELFYDQKLISSGKQPRHDKFYPLTFFTTRGEDVQDKNSTAFYNNSEVYEVVERVSELKKRWPSSWGKLDEHSIGIMTPYADQVFRIRSELRKRRMGGISVERVLNVQGKQFRAIFLSTVRTRRTCSDAASKLRSEDEMDYGFLSNSKLLNTAITRAQSLVAVIGDPVALCSIGRCRKVWERFIDICNTNNSLYGIKWSYLKSLLDGVELKKTYTLNPLAPEFVPRQMQTEAYIRLPSILGPYGAVPHGMRYPPPFLPPASIYPVSPVYYPAYQHPPGSFFPGVRPSAAPIYPAGNASPWGLNYPAMISPNNAAAAGPANGMFPAANGWIKKKPDPLSPPIRREEIRPPPGLVPPPLPAQQRNPAPQPIFPHQVLPRPSPTSPNSILESQQAIQTQQQQPSQQQLPMSQQQFLRATTPLPQFITSHPPPPQPQKHHPLIIDQPRRIMPNLPPPIEKQEQIQFLQNVHFPERTVNGNLCGLSLPETLNLSELLETQTIKQLEFYTQNTSRVDNSLKGGLDNSGNFIEMMAHQPRKAIIASNAVVPDVIRSIEDMFTDKPITILHQNGHIAMPLVESQLAQSQPQDQLHAAQVAHMWYEKSSAERQMANRDLEATLYQQHLLQQQQQQMAAQQRIERPDDLFELWGNNNSSVSNNVPLYRRQPQNQQQLHQQQQHSVLENGGDNYHHLIDEERKPPQMNSASAFAGYAQAYQPHQPQHHLFQQEHESADEMLANIHRQTTYASVVRTQKSESSSPVEEKGDPFAILRELGNKTTRTGLYHYFA